MNYQKEYKSYSICGWHKSEDIHMHSSSGGAFSAFAEQILSEGGVVFAHVHQSTLNQRLQRAFVTFNVKRYLEEREKAVSSNFVRSLLL